MADYGPVPSDAYTDPRLTRASFSTIAAHAAFLGMASPGGRFHGDPWEVAHRIRCRDVRTIEEQLLELVERGIIFIYAGRGLGGAPVVVAQVIEYASYQGLPDNRRFASKAKEVRETFPDPDAELTPSALSDSFDDATAAYLLEVFQQNVRSEPEADQKRVRSQNDSSQKATRREAEGDTKDGRSRGEAGGKSGRRTPPKRPAPSEKPSTSPRTSPNERHNDDQCAQSSRDARRHDGHNGGAQPHQKNTRRAPEAGQNSASTPEIEIEIEIEKEREGEGTRARPRESAPPAAPSPPSSPEVTPASVTADLLPRERRDAVADVPPWPSPEHRDAARVWLERHAIERPYGDGLDPTLLQRLASERPDEFVDAVAKHVEGAKGWKHGDCYRWLVKNCDFVRENREDLTQRRRADRMRNQGSDWGRPRGEPTPTPEGHPGRDSWSDVADSVRELVLSAASNEAVARSEALAEGRRLLATLTDEPADEGLTALVEALALPPVDPGWWEQFLWRDGLNAYDRQHFLLPLVPIGVSYTELALVAPDDTHAQFVAEEKPELLEGLAQTVRWVG